MKKSEKAIKPRTTEKDAHTNSGVAVRHRMQSVPRAGAIVTYCDERAMDWPAIIVDVYEDEVADLVVFGMILPHGPVAATTVSRAEHDPAGGALTWR